MKPVDMSLRTIQQSTRGRAREGSNNTENGTGSVAPTVAQTRRICCCDLRPRKRAHGHGFLMLINVNDDDYFDLLLT